MYSGICAGLPVGLAVEASRLYTPVGSLLLRHSHAVRRYGGEPLRSGRRSAFDLALYTKVTAYDRACTVLLGDPTVAIPLPR